jgi:signal transduction histidine kinase
VTGAPRHQTSLFEDTHTDARMRRTIPQFAHLGAVAVAASAPIAADTTPRRLVLVGLAAVAAVIAFAVSWRGLIDRLPRAAILGLLLSYCVIIAAAVVATDDPRSPFGLFYVLPVTFTAVFFTGLLRYSTAVLAPIVDFTVVGLGLSADLTEHVLRLVLFLLIAHFGAVVADTLREALRARKSLHTVLEAASGSPLDSDLAAIGVDAALSVAGWDAGGLCIIADDHIDVPAVRGVSDATRDFYVNHPLALGDAPLVRPVLDRGETVHVPDIRGLLPADNPLVREGFISATALAVRFRGETIGALVLASRRQRQADRRETDRLEDVAGQLGLALGSAAAYQRETEVADNLRELNRRKDEFLANISHELRTPAATIRLVASTLERTGPLLSPAELTAIYETLGRRSAHLTELIEDLLEEAIADAGRTRLTLAPLDWWASVARWAENTELQSGRAVILDLPTDPVAGIGDSVKLERTVSNLLSNAAKFSSDDSPIKLSMRADGDVVEIVVSDRGIGIPAEELSNIFDRFHQVDSSTTRVTGGFGIGLSLARHFVEAHGGTLTVASQLGEGSAFTMRVPLSPPTTTDAPKRAAPDASATA